MSFSTKNPSEKVRESRFGFTENGDLVVEHAAIMWSNFSGNPTKYNAEGGRRTFELVVTERAALMLRSAGWNIKSVQRKNSDDPVLYVTEIVVNPTPSVAIYLCEEIDGQKIRRKVKTEEIGLLDSYQYSDVCLLIHPYVHGRMNSAGSTVKGYLRQMNLVKINEDYFKEMFADYYDSESLQRAGMKVREESKPEKAENRQDVYDLMIPADDHDGWMEQSDDDLPFM